MGPGGGTRDLLLLLLRVRNARLPPHRIHVVGPPHCGVSASLFHDLQPCLAHPDATPPRGLAASPLLKFLRETRAFDMLMSHCGDARRPRSRSRRARDKNRGRRSADLQHRRRNTPPGRPVLHNMSECRGVDAGKTPAGAARGRKTNHDKVPTDERDAKVDSSHNPSTSRSQRNACSVNSVLEARVRFSESPEEPHGQSSVGRIRCNISASDGRQAHPQLYNFARSAQAYCVRGEG